MESLIKFVEDEFVPKKEFPQFSAGDTITVYYEIKEGEKTRTQFFKGVVIQRRGSGATETFTIRKMSGIIKDSIFVFFNVFCKTNFHGFRQRLILRLQK